MITLVYHLIAVFEGACVHVAHVAHLNLEITNYAASTIWGCEGTLVELEDGSSGCGAVGAGQIQRHDLIASHEILRYGLESLVDVVHAH